LMKVLLATLHSRYVHTSLALPCLASACAGQDGMNTVIREFTVNEPLERILAAIVDEEASVAVFSCYIWNVEETLKIASDLKAVRPETLIILGGPEVSFAANELLARHPAIDCVVRGEGEETFRELMELLFRYGDGKNALPRVSTGITYRRGDEIVVAPERAPMGDLDAIPSPFLAGLVDLAKPLVYYETSRGCPFSCAFCLSSLDRGVRSFSIPRIREDLGLLMTRGAQTVKLVDRTFNYNASRANDIWEFILGENRTSRFHFEIAADLLTEENFRLLQRVPADMFRFEIGVQSAEVETLSRVGRKTDLPRLFTNVERLRKETGVIVHLDLVAGLPGEGFKGFLGSLQQLFDILGNSAISRRHVTRLAPAGQIDETGANERGHGMLHHIQVEPLKVLKGTPMRGIAAKENYAFSASPPYKILHTPWLTFAEIRRIEGVSRLVDLFFNSGRFATTLTRIAEAQSLAEFFAGAAEYWESAEIPAGLSQPALFEALWRCAGRLLAGRELEEVRDTLCFDFCLVQCPSGKALPAFFAGEENTLAKDRRDDILGRLEIAAGSRVRTFSMGFGRDYRSMPWGEGRVELLFVYIAAPGKGLRVEVEKV